MKAGGGDMTHIFIVNPSAGKNKNFAEELRGRLEQMKNLDYYIFNTRYAGYESEIVHQVREVFMDEKLRFYSCGGSGTFRNMLNGFDDFENVEIAMYPQGIANDFVKVFPDEWERFQDIEELINGDVVMVDYMKTNNGICVNHFSVGIDSRVIEITTKNRESCLIGRNVPYAFPVLESMLMARSREFGITIDGENMDGNYVQLIFGNGKVLSGNLHYCQNPDVTDGMGNYFLVPGNVLRHPIFVAMYREKYDKFDDIANVGQWKKIRLVSKDGKPIVANQDGVLVYDQLRWDIEIVPAGLPFVVPKGVGE